MNFRISCQSAAAAREQNDGGSPTSNRLARRRSGVNVLPLSCRRVLSDEAPASVKSASDGPADGLKHFRKPAAVQFQLL